MQVSLDIVIALSLPLSKASYHFSFTKMVSGRHRVIRRAFVMLNRRRYFRGARRGDCSLTSSPSSRFPGHHFCFTPALTKLSRQEPCRFRQLRAYASSHAMPPPGATTTRKPHESKNYRAILPDIDDS